MRELVAELALGLREHVLPQLGSHAGRAHLQTGIGGDVTFAIDEEAEAYLERFLAEEAPEVAYYSEDRGLMGADSAETVLLVDPIDGTRPAMAGLESCCVAVAAAPLGDGAPDHGRRRRRVRRRDKERHDVHRRARLRSTDPVGGRRVGESAVLSSNTDVSRMFWTLGFRGRPAEPLITVLGELIDASSVGGAVFDLGSAAFDLTRLVTGQLDAYLDVGSRMVEEAPSLRSRFEHVGGGAILNNSPYDLAAPVLCLQEAGGVVTDARGDPLAGRPLLGSGHDFQMSCVAAANSQLHERILDFVERGIARLADWD